MGTRLSDRLRQARLQRFVGREAEQALFSVALHAEEPPFFVLHVYGPGGLGKTMAQQRALHASTTKLRPGCGAAQLCDAVLNAEAGAPRDRRATSSTR